MSEREHILWFRLLIMAALLVLPGAFWLKMHWSVSASGSGTGVSSAFRLEQGEYDVHWTATPTATSGCDIALDLMHSDGTPYDGLASGHVLGPATGAGSVTMGLTSPLALMVRADTTCGAWSVTFAPRAD